MTANGTNLIFFTGEYRHGMDPKNRITIPAAWRALLEGTHFYIKIDSSGSCLQILPPPAFNEMLQAIRNHPKATLKERAKLERRFSSRTSPGSCDKQGRMVLPDTMCSTLGLKGEVVLVGISNRFEVWNPRKWEEENDSPDMAGCDALGEEIGL